MVIRLDSTLYSISLTLMDWITKNSSRWHSVLFCEEVTSSPLLSDTLLISQNLGLTVQSKAQDF